MHEFTFIPRYEIRNSGSREYTSVGTEKQFHTQPYERIPLLFILTTMYLQYYTCIKAKRKCEWTPEWDVVYFRANRFSNWCHVLSKNDLYYAEIPRRFKRTNQFLHYRWNSDVSLSVWLGIFTYRFRCFFPLSLQFWLTGSDDWTEDGKMSRTSMINEYIYGKLNKIVTYGSICEANSSMLLLFSVIASTTKGICSNQYWNVCI